MNKNILTTKNIVLNINEMSKEESIILAGKLLVENGYVTEKYISAMLEREKIACSYIGNNVAIPHGINFDNDLILQSGIVVLQSKHGIIYDNNIANIIIGIAGKNNEHLDILSNIAIKIAEIQHVKKMIVTNNVNDIYEILMA